MDTQWTFEDTDVWNIQDKIKRMNSQDTLFKY